jgi:hypothetical protein
MQTVLSAAEQLGLPDWYVGAGAVAQTVWNSLVGADLLHGIVDIDLVYFDPSDLSAAGEEAVVSSVRAACSGVGVALDVKNEARVHLWYEDKFGVALEPYRSTAEAIATWPTTASSVGVRQQDEEFLVCAPFGLTDLFAMVVRPNKRLVSESVYRAKVERWKRTWPTLTVIEWQDAEAVPHASRSGRGRWSSARRAGLE